MGFRGYHPVCFVSVSCLSPCAASSPLTFHSHVVRVCFVPPNPMSFTSAPVLNLNGFGKPLTFRSALADPHGDQWRQANGMELVKLVETSRSLTPVRTATSLPTYLNNVVKEKWFPSALLRSSNRLDIVSDVDRLVRGTVGGDRLTVSSLVSTAVASHPLVNCLFTAVFFENAHFGTVDLTDFYLGTTNPNPPFIKIFLDPYPSEVLSHLRLAPFTKTDRRTGRPCCLFCADKTVDDLRSQGVREAVQRAPRKSPLSVGVCPNLHTLSLSSPYPLHPLPLS
jgi:hypothetical protein